MHYHQTIKGIISLAELPLKAIQTHATGTRSLTLLPLRPITVILDTNAVQVSTPCKQINKLKVRFCKKNCK